MRELDKWQLLVRNVGVAALLLLRVPEVHATPGDREVLRDRLVFWYVATPNAVPKARAVRLDNASAMRGAETGLFWSNPRLAPLQDLVRRLLRAPDAGGDAALQSLASSVITSAPGTGAVEVFLFNDVDSALTEDAKRNWNFCPVSDAGGSVRAWPCATAREDSLYDGRMWLGAHEFSGTSGRATFLHELVHTRDRTDGRAHLFFAGHVNFRYGLDGQHFGVELVPNRAMAYKEGIANAVRLLYDANAASHYYNWLATDGLVFVERATPPAGSWLDPDAWLNDQIRSAGVREEILSASVKARFNGDLVRDYAAYKFSKLPARFMMHNEYVVALVLSAYADYVGTDRLLAAIGSVSRDLDRASGSGIAMLFETLGQLGLPDGLALNALAQSYDGPNTHLLPLAFVDFFTRYRTPPGDQKAFAELFENMLPPAWVDAYVAGQQHLVRAAVPIKSSGTPTRVDLTDVAIALGVRSSTRP